MPVPLNATVCGDGEELSATERDAERWPVAVGWNVTEIVQILPAFNVATGASGQLFVCAKSPGFAPVKPMDEIVSGEAPVFFRVAFCGALAGGPTSWAANVRLGGESDTPGIAPVPLSPIVCCDGVALSEIDRFAVRGPVVVG